MPKPWTLRQPDCSANRRPAALLSERGSALLLAVLACLLMLALGGALVLVSVTDTRIAARFAYAAGTLSGAEAVLDRALADLFVLPDWDAALQGTATSAFTDGPPSGVRVIGDVRLDLGAITGQLRCGRATCGAGDIALVTAERPWGFNNPHWQLFAWGPVSALASLPPGRDVYVLVWVGDDAGETDGDPLRDGSGADDPGRWTLSLVAHAYAPRGLRRRLHVTATRAPLPVPAGSTDAEPGAGSESPGPPRMLAWREVRQ